MKDATLTGRDVGRFATTLNDLDFGIVNGETCKTVFVDLADAGQRNPGPP